MKPITNKESVLATLRERRRIAQMVIGHSSACGEPAPSCTRLRQDVENFTEAIRFIEENG